MPVFNLLYCSKNFRKTTGSFWNYYPDDQSTYYVGNDERTKTFYTMKNSESFDYKTKLVGNLPAGNNPELEDIKIVVPLKNLSRFIFNLNFSMINTEIELILKWSQNCVLTERVIREQKDATQNPAQDAVVGINTPSDLKFNITDRKLYVPIVTLQEKIENKLFKGLKTGIDIDFEWPIFRTQIINQPATNNLNVLTDSTFNNVDRLFVLAFPHEKDRRSFSIDYIQSIEIKYYNVLIDLQPFYDIAIKNKKQTYKAITELFNHDDYTTGNQQIYFVGKLEQDATIFFTTEELVTTGIKFEQNSLSIV